MSHDLTPADVELVARFATTFASRFAIDVTDFVSCGHEALAAAARAYNGYGSFREYAKMRLRGAMSDEVRSRSPVSRKVFKELTSAGHTPGWENLENTWADPGEGPEVAAIRLELEVRVQVAIAGLPADMRHLVKHVYFGGESLEKAGEAIGIGRAWAWRRHAEAIRRLSSSLRGQAA